MSPPQIDILTVVLHEMGHWYSLGHDWVDPVYGPCRHPEAVMCADFTYKPELRDDDKHGVTQMYGPYTGWESSEALGQYGQVGDIRTVAGWNNNNFPPPELGPVSQELGVPIMTGQKYERMAGWAQSSYSYIYFKLFTWRGNDSSATRNYLRIKNGTLLKWRQYNYLQGTMAVDFLMDDGRTLRDSGLRDQNGVSVHPNARGVYPTGQWLFFTVDLSPLVGRVIDTWWLAYDNGVTHTTGRFRAYFDNLEVNYYNPLGDEDK